MQLAHVDRYAGEIGGQVFEEEFQYGLRRERLEAVLIELKSKPVAEACGVTQAAVGTWRRGESSPTHENLHRIARMAGLPVAHFYGEGA